MPRINIVMTNGNGGAAELSANQLDAASAPYGYVEIGSDDLNSLGSFPFRVDQAGNVTAGPNFTPMLQQVASTGAGGFTLQNATPTILTWTAPNDGAMHRVLLMYNLHVTAIETGGAVQITTTTPDGGTHSYSIESGGAGVGFSQGSNTTYLVQAGSTVTVSQSSALTAGTAVLFAEIWAS